MPYTRAGSFSGAVLGAPRETALRVLDAAGADAVLWETLEKSALAGPIVYANEAGTVTFYADPGTYTVRWTGGQTTVTVTGGQEDSAPDAAWSQFTTATAFEQLATGEETLSRLFLTSAAAVAPTSGQLRLTYFTARKTETTTQVRVYTGNTAAAATPTLCRLGLYAIDANSDATLVAAIANDTALFAASLTDYTRSWTTPYRKIAGQRYALGVLVISGATMPSFCGQSLAIATEAASPPVITKTLAGQSDLPATFLNSATVASGQRLYAALI